MGKVVKPEKRLCGTRKKDGNTCKMPAGHGTDHLGWGKCKFHGGTSAPLKIAAAKEQMRARMVAFGTPLDIDPAAALLGEVRRSAGIVAWLETVITQFTQIDLETLREDARSALQSLGEQGREVAVWVELYREERKMLRTASVEALKNNIEERRVQIEEETGAQLARVITAVLDDPELNLSREQRTIRGHVVRRHLSAIA
ncbi:MAG TPA: hypothetical protein VNN79_15475 [Actinomycetota bacterium]|nr:hypothetical protein [Actinomycetota bacterium]